jgi:hypothetical protein
MEDAMCKRLVIILGTIAVISGSLLPIDRAAAGGSSSAPSKYNNHLASASQAQTNRRAPKSEFAITEYSSSARNHSQKH